jgi:NADH dehydrogenase
MYSIYYKGDSKMRVFVTGGTGFIGKHFINKLVSQGDSVICYVKGQSDVKNVPVGVKGIVMDYDDIGSCDIVYHLAGKLGNHKATYQEYYQPHCEMPKEMLKKMNKEQRFVYISTGWVKYPRKDYQKTKIEGEYIVRSSGIDYVIIRPSFVYGEGDYHHLPLFKITSKMGAFTPIIGTGENIISPLYIDDLIYYMLNPVSKEFYVASCQVTCQEFLDGIADAVDVCRPIFTYPMAMRIKNKWLRDKLKVDFLGSEAVFDVQEHTTPLNKGLANTVKWYKANNLL